MILIIESSASYCSVCLAENKSTILGEKVSSNANDHSEKLAVYIDELLKENGITTMQLDAIAISAGPGSYTGLRIGASMAKGLCYSANLPLIRVDALQGLVTFAIHSGADFDFIIPHLDARRNEVYMQLWSKKECINPTHNFIIDAESFSQLENKKTTIIGDCSQKFLLSSAFGKQTELILQHPMARFCIDEAYAKFDMKQFENLAYFEPFYLKDFIPGTPKKIE